MYKFLFLTLTLLSMNLLLTAQMKTFYEFMVTDIDGKPFELMQFKGKKILVVNVASQCGHTAQYKDLEALYRTYKDQHFVVIGFPSNDFGAQEPGTNEEIKNFCSSRYNVTFPMMSKIAVSGQEIAPVYQWLTQKSENGKEDTAVTWNFQKFLIDENGHWVGTVAPHISPLSPVIVNWIDGTDPTAEMARKILTPE